MLRYNPYHDIISNIKFIKAFIYIILKFVSVIICFNIFSDLNMQSWILSVL